jgi:hypothetical protein
MLTAASKASSIARSGVFLTQEKIFCKGEALLSEELDFMGGRSL